MSGIYGEYSTVDEMRGDYLEQTDAKRDPLILSIIREASHMIDSSAKTFFAPRIMTRNFDLPRWGTAQWPAMLPTRTDLLTDNSKLGGMYTSYLNFDWDLLEILTLTNGNATSITSDKYWVYPANYYPKRSLRLKPTSGVTWLPDSSGNWEQVISLNGVWGRHDDYANAWQGAGTVASGLTSSAAAATYTASSGHGIKAGMLLKVDSEYVYAASVSDTAIGITRAVNGSTATTHADASAVYYWAYDEAVKGLARRAATALFRLRNNPLGESVLYEGYRISTPSDVQAYIDKNIDCLGVQRTVFA